LSAYPQHEPPATSLTILGVLAVSSEPSVKARTLWIGHAHTSCPYPRTHPADASAAWRRSPQMAPEPQPHAGALAGAAAGPAGHAVQAPHAAAAAALSHAPRIELNRRRPIDPGGMPCVARIEFATCRDRRRHSQTTPPHGATRRGRRRRGKSGGPPRPREQIRPPQGPVSADEFVLAALNLLRSVET